MSWTPSGLKAERGPGALPWADAFTGPRGNDIKWTEEKAAFQRLNYLSEWQGSRVSVILHVSPECYAEVREWLKPRSPRAVQEWDDGFESGETLVMNGIGLEAGKPWRQNEGMDAKAAVGQPGGAGGEGVGDPLPS